MAYEHISPYDPLPDNSQVHNSFELDSNISDEDIQNLYQEYESVDVSSIERPLAAATVKQQERWFRYWTGFCERLKRDPEPLLLKANVKVFMMFLEWYKKENPRAKRVSTFETIWKGIRQVYYDRAKASMPEDVGHAINKFIHKLFAEKHNLPRGWKEKHTVGHHTLMGMLHYHWTFDTARYSAELQRVQVAAVLLFLAYTGARPGAIVESGAPGIRNTDAALLYRDLKLELVRAPDGTSLLVLEITIRLDKGKRDRSFFKRISVYEYRNCPAMCPIIHFLGIAFADQAFHPELLVLGLTPAKMHSFKHPDRRSTIEFKFRDDILDIPVFRAWHSTFNGAEIHSTRALSAQKINEACNALGKRAGLPHPFTPYSLRREVGTELTDSGVNDQQRNQILGHARSETFLKHYLSTNVVTDVQATFLGKESRSDLIKEMGRLKLRRDPKLPKTLTEEQKLLAHKQPELLAAQAERTSLYLKLKSQFKHIKAVPEDSPDGILYRKLQAMVSKLKLQYERSAFQTLLANFHSNADLEHMVLQLKGEIPTSLDAMAPLQHALSDRVWLANHLFVPANDGIFAEIVETMARLCSVVEPASNFSQQKANAMLQEVQAPNETITQEITIDKPNVPSLKRKADHIIEDVKRSGTFPLHEARINKITPKTSIADFSKLPRRVCLFCYKPGIENHVFNRKDVLRRHYAIRHFQYQVGPFWCPVPGCEILIQDSNHFANHATTTHSSDLGVRASLMKVNRHKVKPGQLQTFRL